MENEEKELIKEKKLIEFLKYAADNCDELFILGDLFDYWFEYGKVIQKGFIRTLGELAKFRDSGKPIHYIIGNHDFMHKNFFENEIGAILYHDSISVELNGKNFYMAHGDGLVKNDLGYKILKKILRNKFFQGLYSIIHPDLGIKLASGSSKVSRDYTTKKHYGEIDGLFEFAKSKIDDGYDFVLFGHSHFQAFENFKQGFYINLGTWLDKPCYGKFETKFEILEWN